MPIFQDIGGLDVAHHAAVRGYRGHELIGLLLGIPQEHACVGLVEDWVIGTWKMWMV